MKVRIFGFEINRSIRCLWGGFLCGLWAPMLSTGFKGPRFSQQFYKLLLKIGIIASF